jgi:hypothetical protein
VRLDVVTGGLLHGRVTLAAGRGQPWEARPWPSNPDYHPTKQCACPPRRVTAMTNSASAALGDLAAPAAEHVSFRDVEQCASPGHHPPCHAQPADPVPGREAPSVNGVGDRPRSESGRGRTGAAHDRLATYNSGKRRSAGRAAQEPFASVHPGRPITPIASRTDEVARVRVRVRHDSD